MSIRWALRRISYKKELKQFLNEKSSRKFIPGKVLYPENKDQSYNVNNIRNPKDVLEEINKMKLERMWIHLKNERLAKLKKNEFSRQKEKNPSILEERPRHPDGYYKAKGLVSRDDPMTDLFDIDESTSLPVGIGFDDYIKRQQQDQLEEEKEDKIRSLIRKFGFYNSKELFSAAGGIDLEKYDTAIRNDLFDKRDPNAKIPYSDIDYENMRSQQKDENERAMHYFSDDEDYRRAADDGGDDDNDAPVDNEDDDDVYENPFKLKSSFEDNFGYSDDEDYDLEPEGPKARKWIKKASTGFGLISDTETDEDFDGMEEWKSYNSALVHPETPDWLKIEIYKAKQAAIKTNKRKLQSAKASFMSGLPFYFIHGPGVKKTKSWLKKYHEHVKRKHPSFKNVMKETEAQLKLATPEIRKKMDHDEKYQNYHFEPQYLNKEFNMQTLLEFQTVPEVYPDIFSGKFNKRLSPEYLIDLEDARSDVLSKGYTPDEQSTEAIELYSLRRTDPFYEHYIQNYFLYVKDVYDDFGDANLSHTEAMGREAFNNIDPVKQVKFPKERDASVKEPLVDAEGRAKAVGKRKTCTAVAWIWPGSGLVTVGKKPLTEYFFDIAYRNRVIEPFLLTNTACFFDVHLYISGGGPGGQSEAARMAVAKALVNYIPSLAAPIDKMKYRLRDPRMVERKKPGRKKARKMKTWVKR